MSRFLLIADLENEREVIQCKVLLEMLDSLGDVIDFCHINNKQYLEFYKYPNVQFSTINAFSYDVVICFNYTKFNKIRKTCKCCPIIWIDTACNDNRLISGLRWINYVDKILFTINIKQHKLYKFYSKLDIEDSIFLLPNINGIERISLRNNNYKVLVAIDSIDLSISPIFSILPILNQLEYLSIDLLIKRQLHSFINDNIKLINKDQIRSLSDYDIVIANKDIALKTILEGNSCIIVGEKGYGGIVRDKNIESLSLNNFNGREGGYFGEPIPPNLLKRDIISAIKSKFDNTNYSRISSKITEIYTRDLYKIKKNLNSQIFLNHMSQSQILSSKLKVNDFFSIIQKNIDQWNIIDEFSKKHYTIGKEEYLILSKFYKPTNVETAIIRSGMNDKINIPLNFVIKLLKNKILIHHGS